MKTRWILRSWKEIGVALVLAGALAVAARSPAVPEVRLVLQITVDGLRGDLLDRYREGLSSDGFRSLLEGGTVFTNAHHEHANTETIVGHATLATGAHPSGHGMTGNVWYDREAGELAYNIEDPESPILPTREAAREGSNIASHRTGAQDRVGGVKEDSQDTPAFPLSPLSEVQCFTFAAQSPRRGIDAPGVGAIEGFWGFRGAARPGLHFRRFRRPSPGEERVLSCDPGASRLPCSASFWRDHEDQDSQNERKA